MANLNSFTFPVRDFESRIKNSKTSFIVDSANFWHNGIHFSSNEEIKNIYDSKVVAMRLSKAYENTYTYDSLTNVYLTFFKRDALTDDTFENYFESQADGYKLKNDLSEIEKEKAYKLVEELFSNSFVLMRHSVLNTKGKEIAFYSLAQHLKPIGRMTTTQKLKLNWFDCSFKKKISFYYYVDVINVSIIAGNEKSEKPNKVPCETSVSYGNDFNDESKTEVEIEWIQNGTKYKGKVEKKNIRDKYKEIKRPARTEEEKKSSDYLNYSYEKKEANKIQIFTSKQYSNRQTKAIVDSKETFKITEAEFVDKYPQENVLKVEYLDNNQDKQTGYVYLAEVTDDDKKTWESLKTQITEKTKDKIEFSDIEINIKLKEGVKVDSVCVPKETTVLQNEVIGFAGFTVTKEKDEKTPENEDATAIHYELFCENNDFMDYRKSKELDLGEPAEYKINANFKCLKKRPTTKQELKTSIKLTGCYYVKKEDTLRIIDDESFIKVKILAKAIAADYYLLKKDLGQWKETPCSVYEVTDKVCDIYKKAEDGKIKKKENVQVQLYAKYNYLYQETNGEYRRVKYVYEPRDGNEYFWIKASIYNSDLKIVNNKNEYLLEKQLSGNEILEVYNELETNEEIKITGGDIAISNARVNKYIGDKIVQTWIEMKINGSPYWVDEKQISAKKDHKPIEQIPYNDWKRYFTEVKIKEIGEYKCAGSKDSIQKLGFTDVQYDLFNRKRHGDDKYTISTLIKSDTKRTDKLYFKNRTEWIKNEKLTKELYKGTQFEEKIKKLREKYVFWDEAQKLNVEGFPKSDTGWYFHAAAFLKHLDKVVATPEFNPYEEIKNKVKLVVSSGFTTSSNGIKYGSEGGIETLNTDSKLNNPGCAPFTIINGEEEYAKLSGVFNEDYLHVARYMNGLEPDKYENYREYYYHFGVDFTATKGTKVKSFIYGKVIAKGWISTNGRCLLVQRESNNYLYLLCHLSGYPENIKENAIITPGVIIAYTGTSGSTDNICSEVMFEKTAHLHLSVLKYDKKVNSVEKILSKTSRNAGYTEISYVWKMTPKYVDPFNYENSWNGMKDKVQ